MLWNGTVAFLQIYYFLGIYKVINAFFNTVYTYIQINENSNNVLMF